MDDASWSTLTLIFEPANAAVTKLHTDSLCRVQNVCVTTFLDASELRRRPDFDPGFPTRFWALLRHKLVSKPSVRVITPTYFRPIVSITILQCDFLHQF